MPEPATKIEVAYADYLAAEAKSETKHEWLRGEVFDMAGGTPEHARLATSLAGELRAALSARPCAVFSADLRIRVLETGLSTYPDVAVVCGRLEVDPADANAATNPVVLVEVLSDSTEAYDRGSKFRHYRRIPSLREYVLVAQREPRIEVYRRTSSGRWELEEAGPGESLELPSVGCALRVDDVYRNPLETA